MTSTGVFLRGMLMGAADIVPGVSGGTMAFITGIYATLLHSIRRFDLALLRLLAAGRVVDAWQHVNGRFLLALVLGIATSILSLARLLAGLLETHPTLLWAFFFGLILASALLLMREVKAWRVGQAVCLLCGVVIAVFIALTQAGQAEVTPATIFGAGFIAICAMILPGISGSFILLLLGMYAPTLAALRGLDLGFIALFALGAGLGLMAFSRLLDYLLSRFRQATMALLTGFLLGSLLVVWPWKRVLSWTVDSAGEPRALQSVPVSPAEYLTATGQSPQLALCLALMLLGFALVWLIESRWGAAQSGG